MPTKTFQSDLRKYVQEVDKQCRIEMRNGLQEIGEEWRAHYLRVVQQWSNKPQFTSRVRVPEKNTITLYVFAEGENALIWGYVDKGTKPHIIRSKGDYPLRFRGGYSARTQPVAQYNQGDGRAHGQWVSKYQVNHPGNEARKFGEDAEKKIRPKFDRVLNNAIRRGINRVT